MRKQVWLVLRELCVASLTGIQGILKGHIPHTHIAITKTLQRYFREGNIPKLQLRVPNEDAYSPPSTPPDESSEPPCKVNVLLISAWDGRGSMVELTRLLAGMAQQGKITLDQITTELINTELNDGIMGEPDLLILFGPKVVLDGYPPWQVRLTEIL
jgi:dehydrodolichyl diphosphate syntase complex subunit NUS1